MDIYQRPEADFKELKLRRWSAKNRSKGDPANLETINTI